MMNQRALKIAFQDLDNFGKILDPRNHKTPKRIPWHRVYMEFECKQGIWYCRFYGRDRHMLIAREFHFLDVKKLYIIVYRGRKLNDKQDADSLGRSIVLGFGSVWLWLDDKQYRKLVDPKITKPPS